ncbi:MAG: hypothetical protein JNJ58_05455 [Chitinophagaceae bacterium]|nr:hypothetical protein [Chitinophagaceae bacterium]
MAFHSIISAHRLRFKMLLCLLLGYGLQSGAMILQFHPRFHQQTVLPNDSTRYILQGDTLMIQSLKWYISSVCFLKQGHVVWQEDNSYHLLDATKPTSLILALNTPDALSFDQVQFVLGIDSSTQSGGVMGVDLDPVQGMYWTWQSGYIHFKMEGISNRSSERDHSFQYHVGGYQYPENTVQTINLPVMNAKHLQLAMDIDELLPSMDMKAHPHIMSPGVEAVRLSEKIKSIFKVLTP